MPLRLTTVSSDIIQHCNLNCSQCNRLAKYQYGIIGLDQLETDYKAWHHRLQPDQFGIIGGEPFLHPNLADVLRLARQYWVHPRIKLHTNGLLLSCCDPDLFRLINTLDISIGISLHSRDNTYIAMISNGVERAKAEGCSVFVRDSCDDFSVMYLLNEKNEPIPPKGDPETAYKTCRDRLGDKFRFISIYNGKLYTCYPQVAVVWGRERGRLSSAWDNFEPECLSADCTDQELADFIKIRPISFCKNCIPAKPYIPNSQVFTLSTADNNNNNVRENSTGNS
jgi:hypothetical protein